MEVLRKMELQDQHFNRKMEKTHDNMAKFTSLYLIQWKNWLSQMLNKCRILYSDQIWNFTICKLLKAAYPASTTQMSEESGGIEKPYTDLSVSLRHLLRAVTARDVPCDFSLAFLHSRNFTFPYCINNYVSIRLHSPLWRIQIIMFWKWEQMKIHPEPKNPGVFPKDITVYSWKILFSGKSFLVLPG